MRSSFLKPSDSLADRLAGCHADDKRGGGIDHDARPTGGKRTMISRRDMLAATAAGAVATTADAANFGNPDEPPQGAVNATNPSSLTDPGPQNPAIAGQFPSALSPPATDVGSLPLFWASFNNAPKRVQDGGWARQVTQADFAILETIAGVNMRLTAGGIRELHWHLAAEWAYMTYGRCQITVLTSRGGTT